MLDKHRLEILAEKIMDVVNEEDFLHAHSALAMVLMSGRIGGKRVTAGMVAMTFAAIRDMYPELERADPE